MPLERQQERAASSLRPIDRYFLTALACAAAIGTGAGVYAYSNSPPAPSNNGCVVVTVASSLGGGTLRNCGAAAMRFCRVQGPVSGSIAAACRSRGFATVSVRKTE